MSGTPTDIADWRREGDALVGASREASTTALYTSSSNKFLKFLDSHGISRTSPSFQDVSAYCAKLVREGYAASTISNHVTAVRALYRSYGIPIAADLPASWQKLAEGIRRSARPSTAVLPAVTLKDLTLICRVLDNMQLLSVKVAVLFGFFGLLRISNYTTQKPSSFDIRKTTVRDDIHLTDWGLVIVLRWTKTMQSATSTAFIPLAHLREERLCPVCAWNKYIDQTPHVSGQEPLLRRHDKPNKFVTDDSFRNTFKSVMRAAGLSAKNYTPHALRRGGATFMHDIGVPLEEIQRHGTWRSSSINDYLRHARPEAGSLLPRLFPHVY